MRKRKLNRLNVWNYNSIGYYYITINTMDSINYFGDVQNDKMELSDIGQIANKCWIELPSHINNIFLDKFIIMPNHFHGIIKILQSNEYKPESPGFNMLSKGFKLESERFKSHGFDIQTERFNVYGTGMPVPYDKTNIPYDKTNVPYDKTNIPYDKTNAQYKKLPIIIGSYKSAVSKLAHKKGYGNFGWHKSYYDHIVRNEKDLNRIRKYITNNPAKWNKN